jgi:ABC-type cobalt transport system, permease component CbiQ and related transporters
MLFKINPSYKCIGVLIPALFLSFCYQVVLNISIFGICILLLLVSKVSVSRIIKSLFQVLIAAVGLFMTGFLFSKETGEMMIFIAGNEIVYSASVDAGLQVATRILLFAGLGMLFSLTTDGKEFVCSLEQQFGLPSRFTYGILAAFHLLPMIPREYKKTIDAFLARGKSIFPLSPAILIPFIIKSIRWSESLAIAMESKGFDSDGERTCMHVITVKWFDYLFMGSIISIVIVGIIINW